MTIELDVRKTRVYQEAYAQGYLIGQLQVALRTIDVARLKIASQCAEQMLRGGTPVSEVVSETKLSVSLVRKLAKEVMESERLKRTPN